MGPRALNAEGFRSKPKNPSLRNHPRGPMLLGPGHNDKNFQDFVLDPLFLCTNQASMDYDDHCTVVVVIEDA